MSKPTIICEDKAHCPLEAEVHELRAELEHLSALVSTDTLTGLYNYRYFSTAIAQELERSQRTTQPTVLIMGDVDHFKQVNDQWGHEVGNQALTLIAHSITGNIRKLDIACRYGGEEFAIILPSTSIITAVQVSERIRTAIETTPLIIDSSDTPIRLTISLGFSICYGHPNDNTHKLIEQADAQLYRAKQAGRNRIAYVPEENNQQQVDSDEKSALFTIFDNNKP
ncbi:MAG: GGDEF domain-containing protein [Cellvibrionaceae bacterium]|nr:GGDEF domain-containing protein [Cellvibrionaceae bacterium]